MADSEPVPGPAYRIVTPRLVIRCPEPADAPALDSAIRPNRDHLLPWLVWAKQEPVNYEQRIAFLRRVRSDFDADNDYGYLIFDRQDTFLLGGTGLHTRLGPDVREIGYWIHKDHINLGYATEASAALTRVAFEIDHVRRVEIHCHPDNLRSAAIPRKLGFVLEATLHDRVEYVDGDYRDTMIWSMFAKNYPSSSCAEIEIQAFDVIGRKII